MIDTHTGGRHTALARRGTKQTCDNEACRNRFYDLARTPCACPYCGVVCDADAIVILNFDTLGKPPRRKFDNRAEPRKPVVALAKAGDEKADSDLEASPTGEVLMIEDDEGTDAEEQAPEEESDENN